MASVSSASSAPCSSLSPSASAAQARARLVMLLEPGIVDHGVDRPRQRRDGQRVGQRSHQSSGDDRRAVAALDQPGAEALGLGLLHDQDQHAGVALARVRDLEVGDVDGEGAGQGGDLGQDARAVGHGHPNLAHPGRRDRAASGGSDVRRGRCRGGAATRRGPRGRRRPAGARGTRSARRATRRSRPGSRRRCPARCRGAPTRCGSCRGSRPRRGGGGRGAPSARASARPMSAAAVRWGTWDTTATSASCCSGASATTSAPSSRDDTVRAACRWRRRWPPSA